MSKARVATGIAIVALLGSAIYEYNRAAGLEVTLSTLREQQPDSQQQLLAVQRDLTERRRRSAAAERPAAAAAAPAAVVTENAPPPPPPPGVTPKAPKGWFKNGSANDLYEVGVDENNAWGGMPSAYAKSTGAADGKFGGMMQTISAEAFRNQRVRLTGWVKTEDATNGGHLWLRIDGQEPGRQLGFDNMNGRAPKGTTDWQEHSIVLDVPPDAGRVNYGFFVSGQGKMWVNGVTITPVGTDVPTTNMMKPPTDLPKTPVNLGFSPPKE